MAQLAKYYQSTTENSEVLVPKFSPPNFPKLPYVNNNIYMLCTYSALDSHGRSVQSMQVPISTAITTNNIKSGKRTLNIMVFISVFLSLVHVCNACVAVSICVDL